MILIALMVFALSGNNLYASYEQNAEGPELRIEEWMTEPFEISNSDFETDIVLEDWMKQLFELSIEENRGSEDADSADEVTKVSEIEKNEELFEDEWNTEDKLELEDWMSTSWF